MLVGGSLVYVKFMYLPIVILTAFLIDIYLYYVRNRKILALPVFIVSLLVSWLLAGQKLRNIFSFFKLSLSVTKGYTEAMISGRPFPFLIFGIAIFILFLLIIKSYTIQNKKHKILERILFTLGCSISLFLAFKHDQRYAIDCRKIKEELGWQQAFSFDEGLMHTVKWYLSNGSWIEGIKSGEYRRWMEQNYQGR